jgi:GNAT superfamily N-acetyltransferase
MPLECSYCRTDELLALLELDRQCHPRARQAWTAAHYRKHFRQPFNNAVVARLAPEGLVGACVYSIDAKARCLCVLRFHVLPSQRRQGIGSALLKELHDRADKVPDFTLQMSIGEANLAAQLFLKHHGWRATEILKEEGKPDCYLFERVTPACQKREHQRV